MMEVLMPHLLTVSEFGTAYGVSRSRIYELLASGELEAVKIGRATRIPDESAKAWKAKLPTFQPRCAHKAA
jgi:excisionase family DNA binding protein